MHVTKYSAIWLVYLLMNYYINKFENVIFHLQNFKHRKIIKHRAANVHQFIVVKVSVKGSEISVMNF